MEYATRDDVRIAYDRRGPDADGPDADGSGAGDTGAPPDVGDDAPVVLLEGLGYGRWMWEFVRECLPGRETIVPDNRGTGDSDVPTGPYAVEEMAADLEAVLSAADVESAHLVGASMGGMIALTYALDHDRARSLSLLCTTPGGPDAVPTPPETADRIVDVPADLDDREAIRYRMAPALSPGFAEREPDLVERIVDWRLESDAPDRARRWQLAAVEAFDASDRLGDVDVPALVVHGTADRVVPVENGELLAERLPDARLVRVADGSHLFFVEEPSVAAGHFRRFVDDV